MNNLFFFLIIKIMEFIKRYHKALYDSIDHYVEPQLEEIFEISKIVSEKLNDKNGRIFVLASGQNGALLHHMIISFDWLFRVKENKLFMIVPGAFYKRNEVDNWKEYENDSSIGSIEAKNEKLNENDLVIAFSVTGETLYINGFLKEAHSKGSKTIMVLSNFDSDDKSKYLDKKLVIDLEEKIIKGLYVGNYTTIFKLVFEMIFYSAFRRMGQISRGRILTTKIWTEKMFLTSREIIKYFTGIEDDEKARSLVKQCDGELDVLIVSVIKNMTPKEARELLIKEDYNVKKIIA